MFTFKMTRTEFVKKTKTTWEQVSEETGNVSERFYKNYTSKESLQMMRRLGGSETVQRSYTCYGYVPTRIISTSPDRETKIITRFLIDWVD